MTQRICSVDECENPHVARGFCQRHYYRARAAGDIEPLEPSTHTLSSIDTESMVADCLLCGPGVDIVIRQKGGEPHPWCAIRHAEHKAWRRARMKALAPEERERLNEYHRNYLRAARYKLRIRRGIVQLLANAGSCCEICATPLTVETARIDHDHACCPQPKGKTCGECVRGVLCNACNLGLGYFRDSRVSLLTAVEYLRTKGAASDVAA